MPVLVVDGKIGGSLHLARCEWCGVEIRLGECHPVQGVYYGEQAESLGVLTRMCGGCLTIYTLLGRDGLKERP